VQEESPALRSTRAGRAREPWGRSLGAWSSLTGMPEELTPREVSELLSHQDVQLIDVRQPHEHEAGRIAGDRLIELAQLAGQAATLDRDRPIVFYCRSGGRSAMATEAFAQAGYRARNLAGGLLAWREAGLPLEPEHGTVADS
jgi:rhodanese-related sulfurtransferase